MLTTPYRQPSQTQWSSEVNEANGGMQLNVKQTIRFLVFAIILWGGGWLGGMLGGILGVATLGGVAGQAAGFLLSAFIVYWLWNHWGKQAAG